MDRAVWYVRRNGKRIRLRADFGTPDFDAEYQAALAGNPLRSKAPNEGTLAWLIERYRETSAWSHLSAATRRQRENIFLHVLETAGNQPLAKITPASIIAGRERRAATPAQARNFLDAMRGLFRWAADARMVKVDPTISVKNPPRKKGAGFRPWTEDDVTAYERRWPIGTRQRVWLDLLLYTGLRRGDAVRLGRQHVRDGIASIKTEKSGFTVTVTLPILDALAETLPAGPCGDLTFIAGENGHPLAKESFGNLFREACRTAGVPGRRTASARLRRPGRRMPAPPLHSWRQSSAGKAARWRLFTRGRQTGAASRWRRCTRSRTRSELLLSHLSARCDTQRENISEINGDFLGWCGREDSNLHGLPR